MSSEKRLPIGSNPREHYYPALDGVRAMAILLVFFGHYANLMMGWAGVNVFFVLSGFLITGILYDARGKPNAFRNFFARRSLRIFPVYYCFWILILLLTPIIHVAWQPLNFLWLVYLGNWIPLLQRDFIHHPEVAQLVFYPLGRHGVMLIDHFWSLCFEEQFYLVWPFIVLKCTNKKTLLRICFAVIVLSPLLRALVVAVAPLSFTLDGSTGSITFLRFDEFLIGGAAALILRGPKGRLLQSSGKYIFIAGLLILLGISGYDRLHLHHAIPLLVYRPFVIPYVFPLIDWISLGLILMCLRTDGLLSQILTVPPLRYLGRISYGFYILHDVPHSLYLFIARNDQSRTLLIAFFTTLALATLSFRFLETPFLRLKTRFES